MLTDEPAEDLSSLDRAVDGRGGRRLRASLIVFLNDGLWDPSNKIHQTCLIPPA